MTDTESTFEDEILERLDELAALLTLAHGEAIERTRSRLRSDALTAAILDAGADDWISAGALTDQVRQSTGAGASTIRRRVAELVSARALRSRGSTHTRAYHARGIV